MMRGFLVIVVVATLLSSHPVAAQSVGEGSRSGDETTAVTTRNVALDRLLKELNDAGLPKVTERDRRWPAAVFPKLPPDKQTILIPNLFPTNDDGVPSWIKRNEQFQIPSGPATAAENINTTAREFAQSCATRGENCTEARAFGKVVSALRNSANMHPDCDAAARAYAKDYDFANPTDAVTQAYDAACLGSLSPRFRGATAVAAEPVPAVFTGGPDGTGARSAIAILEASGTPFCGGLLRNDQTVVTARHCVQRNQSAFDAKRVTVRSATGQHIWQVASPPASSGSVSQRVRDDWAVLKLSGNAPVAVVDVALARFDIAQELTLVGTFSGYPLMDYRDGSASWRHSLRYPRAGMCQGLVVDNGCLVLTCQTVPGFSGAPIFRMTSENETPTVVGFVSGTLSATTGCPAAGPYPTLAVSADKIR